MNLVLFFGEIFSYWDERLETHHSDGILLILRKLTENWENFLKNMLFLELGSEKTESRGTCSPNHWSVFITQLNELLPELFFLWS